MQGRFGIMRCCYAAGLVGSLLLAGCQRVSPPATPYGSPAGVKLEIQYNAVRALAYRGSPQFGEEHLDKLAEMLDEEKQLQNFRVKLKDGSEVPDQAEARTTVLAALKAAVEFHGKRPDFDLSKLEAPIRKLATSDNEILRQEAKKTLIALGKS